MWLLSFAMLLFTATDLTVTEATVFGNINSSPEEEGQPREIGLGLASSGGRSIPAQAIDFIDTHGASRPRGYERNPDDIGDERKEADVFSKLKHLPMLGSGSRIPSHLELAELRRSLATIMQVLHPYPGHRWQSQHHARTTRPSEEDGIAEGTETTEDGMLAGRQREPTNFLLHGKLIEVPTSGGAGPLVDGPRTNGGKAAEADDGAVTVGQKRAAALRSTVARRSHAVQPSTMAHGGSGEDTSFLPSISVGALTNLGDFFQNLKHNLESLESKNLNTEQVKLLEGQNMISSMRKGFFYSRDCRGLSKAGGQCRFPARHPELSAIAPYPRAGVHRAGALPWHELSRSRLHACRTRKMSYPPTIIRPPLSAMLAGSSC
ncbi:uncharacterized protein LOC118465618 isoform X2 [Anopheles albimanus]|uniref:uncharacterized protein LOC118465618 isoform X2 n=1 Tax=Anopheles albimanus TaxID=7167 RepID=UPI0016402A21|nr:uncharacterized protein LOC118465618 isoform X2 [Anopheles albimanus]